APRPATTDAEASSNIDQCLRNDPGLSYLFPSPCSRVLVSQVLAQADEATAHPGSCRKTGGVIYIENGREMHPLPFVFPLLLCLLVLHLPLASSVDFEVTT